MVKRKSHAKPGKSVKPTQSTFKNGRCERGSNPLNLWRINWWGPYIDVRYDADYEASKIAFAPDDNIVYLLYFDEDNIDGDSFNNFSKVDPNVTHWQEPVNWSRLSCRIQNAVFLQQNQ